MKKNLMKKKSRSIKIIRSLNNFITLSLNHCLLKKMKIKTYNNSEIEIDLPDNTPGNLIALPALIDPHVHFRTPGAEHKENWITGAQAAIAGGVTTVFDMPNNWPSAVSHQHLELKKKIIDKQLNDAGIPLNYFLYLGATADNLNEIEKIGRLEDYLLTEGGGKIVGVKLFMDASTGDLLVDKLEDQEKIFKTCAELNLLLAVHAVTSAERAIELAKKYHTKLYICHVSTKKEIDLIRQTKTEGFEIYAEVTPHHLFLTENDHEHLGTLGKMNPPLHTTEDQKALWEAIFDGTIDTVGTDHAPHTLTEKSVPEAEAPFGVPGIETSLPLLLDAYNQGLPSVAFLSAEVLTKEEAEGGKISLEKIVELTSLNAKKIFGVENNDWVVVDLDFRFQIENFRLKTKCGWSPFSGWELQGKPVVTILNNKTYFI
ncbi:MAG: dihydroorotase family protein [Candidatus Magasanikbacteria bacterium]